MAPRPSAGLLLYREPPDREIEVFLGRMGGPFWARRDRAWSIPKGEIEDGERPLVTALREFTEETGQEPPAEDPDRPDLDLGEVRQKSGKVVRAWARRVDPDGAAPDPDRIAGNRVALEWPPRSGRTIEVPEIERAAWVPLTEARALVVAAQEAFLDRLAAHLTTTTPSRGAGSG